MRFKGLLSFLLPVISVQVYANDTVKQHTSHRSALITAKTEHVFSNPATKDHFELIVNGKSVMNGKIRLFVSTSNHKLIFTDSFDAYGLMYDYDEDGSLSTKQKEILIRKRISRFFADSCFVYPAIKIAEPFYDDNSAKANWLDIKLNKEAIGFVYSYGYEGTYAIAYSKMKRKAVLYYSSD